jgi:glutathione synthase/RimK-type ligase-like ATP-grasp enzyme
VTNNNGNNSLCIIGTKKSQTNINLLNEAKKVFGSVLFVPIESIGVGLSEDFSIRYRVTDLLKFKAVFPRVPRKISSYAYQLLSLFPEGTYMPVRPISFLLAEEGFFLLTVLRKRNISTINLHMTKGPKAAVRMLEDATFPLVIRIPDKKTGVVVKNVTEAKGVVDALGSLDQSVLIEDLVKNVVSVYVAEPDVIASVKKKTKEKDVVFAAGELKKQNIDLKTKQLALDAAKAIDAQVAKVDISLNGEPKIVNIELNPDLVAPSKAVGNNLSEMVIKAIHENYSIHQQKPMLMKFFDDAKSVVKDVLKTKQL